MKSQQLAIRNKEKIVQAVHKDRGPLKKQFQKQSGTKRPDQKLSCYRCGKSPLHDRQQCPAKEAECRYCGKRGHYQAVCTTKNIGKVHQEQYDSDEEVFLGAVHSKGDNQWTISIELNGKPTEFQIDTGAEASLIPEEVYKKIGSPTLSKVHQTFRGPNKAVIPVMGLFIGALKHKGNETQQEIYVVKRLHTQATPRTASNTSARASQTNRRSASGNTEPNRATSKSLHRFRRIARRIYDQIARRSQALRSHYTKARKSEG